MAKRGRKPITGRVLTGAERQRRYREKLASQPGQRRRPPAGSIEEQALKMAMGRRAVHFVLTDIKAELIESLARRPTDIPDPRLVAMGARIGLGEALAAIERHLDWVKPSGKRHIADQI